VTSTRVAAAPISWGVCEVPGWGEVLPVDHVLAEMAALGLRATELGPPGFLPEQAESLRADLAAHDLILVGGFVALVLHDPAVRETTLAEVERACALLSGAGGEVLVVAAATGLDGYDNRPELDADKWRYLVDTVQLVSSIASEHGLTATLHPHVGTHVESASEVDRFLASSSVPLCLDTGHLLIGGTDPLAFVREHGDRVVHVHLKDVDADVAARYRAGDLTLVGATQAGLFRPLGQGDASIAEVLAHLDAHGYEDWLVLEQDTAITGEEPPVGSGPVLDVQASIEFLTHTAPREERVA